MEVSTLLPRGVRLEALDIDPQRRAGGAGAGQAIDDARAILEMDADALMRRIRAVDRIVIGEIIGVGDLQRAILLALEAGAGRRAAP